jgi:hypothetical protein
MIKLKSLLLENNDEARRKDWLERHQATFDNNRLIAYHGTTPFKAKFIKQNGFKEGSYFTLRPSYAKHWGSVVLPVKLPLEAIDFVSSDIIALRNINWAEII